MEDKTKKIIVKDMMMYRQLIYLLVHIKITNTTYAQHNHKTIIICLEIIMQQTCQKNYDYSTITFKIRSEFQLQNLQPKCYSKDRGIKMKPIINVPFKMKRRVVTEMTQKEVISPHRNFRITQSKFKAQDLKQQFYLINLCKKLEATSFKLKNTIHNPSFINEENTRSNHHTKKSKERQKKSIKRSRQVHRVMKYNTELVMNQRQTLKNRMKILQMTLPTFRT